MDALVAGAPRLALDRADLMRAICVIDTYADLNVGLADASLVVLADRYRTRTILTLDRRHFDLMRPLAGGHFEILP